jgi:hypothetical protein
MKLMPKRCLRITWIALIALGTAVVSTAQISIDTTNAADWKIGNGVLAVDWNSLTGHIFSIHWSAFPNQKLIDQTNRDSHGPKGSYIDNAGNIGGTTTPSYYLDRDRNYVDFWIAHQADSTSPFAWSWHDVLFAGDPGFHVYFVLDHGPGDLAASVGQVQWVFRGDLTQFTSTYSVNTGLGDLGAATVPMPEAVLFGTSDAGRNVQDATVDLHGLSLPSGFRREFYTKYDYSSYEYLHQAEGVYGSSIGAWMVLPSRESLTGGPTKQDLIFTGSLLIMEAYSNHLDNQINFTLPQGALAHRLYGPYYLHFNALSDSCPTAASLYREALSSARRFRRAYDNEAVLLGSGHVRSTDRGVVEVSVKGATGLKLNQGWVVLSDQNTNFQYSHAANEYWENISRDGVATLRKVVPGTYRLSVYVLGQWGEMRMDGVSVTRHQTTEISGNFSPENFGRAEPIWTIGTADRSSHEFLHGQTANPVDLDLDDIGQGNPFAMSLQDDREYWGNWNYRGDFAATTGGVIYYATPVGPTPATNDLMKWNYNQWHIFNPGLYAGIYPSDDTTDGYKHICPAYVGNCATAVVPDRQVHFTTNAAQQCQRQYVVLSVGLADTEADLTASLNGNPLAWHGLGLDALRMEITNTSAAHEVTGWNDYEYLNSSTCEAANDGVANNNP